MQPIESNSLSKAFAQAIPADPRRILLLNPTKYLGNLLLAGGLIQDFALQCRQQNREFLVVLDAAFQELCAPALAGIPVLWYPRQAIKRAGTWQKLRLFTAFIVRLRAFRADLAFNIEEDSLASRLTQFSGARYRLGCSPQRHRLGYHKVLPLQYGMRHRWHDYQAVFAALKLPAQAEPAYINLEKIQCTEALIQKLDEYGVNSSMPLVAIHPAATKDYKKWPESSFGILCKILINNGFIPILVGAGRDDSERCERILAGIPASSSTRPLNLCNKLSLAELAGFLTLCRGMVGNDSGPSHLASALGLPGIVIFGPSDPGIWGPLGAYSQILRKVESCDRRCSRRACYADYRCLREISPQEVFGALSVLIAAKEAS